MRGVFAETESGDVMLAAIAKAIRAMAANLRERRRGLDRRNPRPHCPQSQPVPETAMAHPVSPPFAQNRFELQVADEPK
jgi:hypothetical protein